MTRLIPTYALYGEYLEEGHRDILHYEPLRERSEKHNWSIQPHRHDTLWQIFHFQNSGIRMQLGRETIVTNGPLIVFIPPLFVHAFQFPKNASGGVISIRTPVVERVLSEMPDWFALTNNVWKVGDSEPEFVALAHSFGSIRIGFEQIDQLRNRHLEANLVSLLISFFRHTQSSNAPHELKLSNQNDQLVRQFCSLVEENFTDDLNSDDYAKKLGISTVSLNRKCRSALEISPKKLLSRRRIFEAKRLLQFTQLSVAEIGEQLGFRDPSYFCRFFKRETQLSPAVFRRTKK